MKKGEIVICFFLIILCSLLLWMTMDFPSALTKDDVGPALFPGIILASLLLLTTLQLFYSFRGKSSPVRLIDSKLQVICCILFLLYIFLIPILGFIIITPLFLFLISRLLQVKSWVLSISYSMIVSGLVWYFFEKISGIPLPSGIL